MGAIETANRIDAGVGGPFDVVVIGSGVGGLSVSSILAQRGWKVLLLERSSVLGAMSQPFTSGGYRWTPGVHYVGGMGLPDSAALRLFDYVTGNGIEWVKPSKIFSRIVIGDREYRIPAGTAQYANALKGYFPTEAKAIDDYIELVKNVSDSLAAFLATPLAKYPDRRAHEQIKFAYFDTFAGRRTIEVLSELTNDTELHAVLCGSWGDYGPEPSRSSFAAHASAAAEYLDGGCYLVGGGQSFANSIVPIIERAGGRVQSEAEVNIGLNRSAEELALPSANIWCHAGSDFDDNLPFRSFYT